MQDDPLDQNRRALFCDVIGQIVSPVLCGFSANLSDKFLSCKHVSPGSR
jgi:hypothetical protein